MLSAAEAEDSSDFQHLGEGLSPASCTERNAAQRPLVPLTPTGAAIQTSDLQPALPVTALQQRPERFPEEVRRVPERLVASVSVRARVTVCAYV